MPTASQTLTALPASTARLLDELERFATLPDDWDSYGATAPERSVIDCSRETVVALGHLGEHDVRLTPGAGNNIELAFKHRGTSFVIEIDDEGWQARVQRPGEEPLYRTFEPSSPRNLDRVLALAGSDKVASPAPLLGSSRTAPALPGVSVPYAANGTSTTANELGMRAMQERAYARRGERYHIIKSPPASGKSRALMFIALDKLYRQGLRQAIITVPERSIGASFHDEPLRRWGFAYDWHVEPRWNLCEAAGEDGSKVRAVEEFLQSSDKTLVCTHATFRFAVDALGVEAFDDRLLAVDEFHHVSANPDNRLGEHVRALIARDKLHIVAMTGSYFRGDAEAVLLPEDEDRFAVTTYTYYEQLNGYEHLKRLDIGYYFYSGSYADEIMAVLDPAEKTILHIPNVNSRESTRDKTKEVEHIIDRLGEWQGVDQATGFYLVRTPSGKTLRVADLVDDELTKRERVARALRDPAHKHDRDHVDLIIALGMAKEGFDWVWCEHALTVGYRSSLTEIIQIIGRATRDAPGKSVTRFTNLIAEPDASELAVREAVNDTLKAIAASLLMEQVLTPKFDFTPKYPQSRPLEGVDYGPDGYDPKRTNVGVDAKTGRVQVEIKGLKEPKTAEGRRICTEDLTDLVATFVQDRHTLERGMFDQANTIPEELTQVRMGKIIAERYPNVDEEDREALRQRAVAAINLVQQGQQPSLLRDDRVGYEADPNNPTGYGEAGAPAGFGDSLPKASTAFVDGIRKFALSVTELDIDLIDRINPFGQAYAVLAKAMDPERLRQVEAEIAAKRVKMDLDEAREYAKRAVVFKRERGRLPALSAADPYERLMAEAIALLQRKAIEKNAK